MMKRRDLSLISGSAGVVLSCMFFGCQSVSPTTDGNPATSVPFPADRPATPNEAVASAPSAVRLTNLEGALLMYYADNQRLPQLLEELKSLPDGAELNLSSPESGQPYSYSPDGLLLAGSSKRIVVWDPSAGRSGKRWCILMPRTTYGAPVSLELVELPEAVFQKYVPAIN